MSHAATLWAIQQRGLKPTTKIVLWHLCDRFNPDYGCFPTQDRLAHDCEIGRATLNRHLDELEARGLIRRVRITDTKTGQQRPTRYLLGFEFPGNQIAPSDFGPEHNLFSAEITQERPRPELGHGANGETPLKDSILQQENLPAPCLNVGHGPVSQFSATPCLKNGNSRVSNRDTNLVREPVSKPVKEEEDARARETLDEEFFEELLTALGIDPNAPLPGWWQGWPPREHVRRWQTDLGLTKAEILEAAEASRQDHPAPPDGPKALDRLMQRAAQRKADDRARNRRKPKAAPPAPAHTPITDIPAFCAEVVNSERYLPVSAISNTMRDTMLARGLVTAERLRERGIR